MAATTMTDADARRALAQELSRFDCRVAQPDDPPLFTRFPKPAMKALHWRSADLTRLLAKIGSSLKLEGAGPRRTLRLTNPGLMFGTTPTIWCSIQYILPNEVATCHRHTATALRFIMEGTGARTTVEGERYEMNKGDLVLTPSSTWHDHEHLGEEPMVWLDVLDISLVRALDATFFDPGDQDLQSLAAQPERSVRSFGSGLMRPAAAQAVSGASPLLVYPWARAETALLEAAGLEPDMFDDTLLEYQNPLNGASALPTIGTAIQRLRPGFKGAIHRHTGSVVYYIVRGNGVTTIEDERFAWGPGDFIALPAWAAHRIENASDHEDAVLFQVNDIPVLKTLGLYREAPGA